MVIVVLVIQKELFSVGQHVGAIMRNGGKLLGVGFFSSLFGEY